MAEHDEVCLNTRDRYSTTPDETTGLVPECESHGHTSASLTGVLLRRLRHFCVDRVETLIDNLTVTLTSRGLADLPKPVVEHRWPRFYWPNELVYRDDRNNVALPSRLGVLDEAVEGRKIYKLVEFMEASKGWAGWKRPNRPPKARRQRLRGIRGCRADQHCAQLLRANVVARLLKPEALSRNSCMSIHTDDCPYRQTTAHVLHTPISAEHHIIHPLVELCQQSPRPSISDDQQATPLSHSSYHPGVRRPGLLDRTENVDDGRLSKTEDRRSTSIRGAQM